MAVLLDELSSDSDEGSDGSDVPTRPLAANNSESWRHSFDGYLNSPDDLAEGQSIVQWWGVSTLFLVCARNVMLMFVNL